MFFANCLGLVLSPCGVEISCGTLPHARLGWRGPGFFVVTSGKCFLPEAVMQVVISLVWNLVVVYADLCL